MPKLIDERVRESLRRAKALITSADPEILSTTAVSEKVAEEMGLSVTVARLDLRRSVKTGELVELRPDRGWRVSWPGVPEAGLTVRLIREYVRGEDDRMTVMKRTLSADTKRYVGTSYGPGNTTFLITKEQADRFVETVVAENEAEKKVQTEAYEAKKKAEKKEIGRREPGFAKEIRRMRTLLNPVWADRVNYVTASVSDSCGTWS